MMARGPRAGLLPLGLVGVLALTACGGQEQPGPAPVPLGAPAASTPAAELPRVVDTEQAGRLPSDGQIDRPRPVSPPG